ncbi:hypothetical protein [Cohnella luojiensis]|uniref:CobQ/CobB/MinD/ParA nucleotide binding domain-containing protein n=1 Tax=Cohnella luojiensis TaxID=652876 RepID=A0A4Y8M0K8_9BACL|nr:hypothetical protein [Cohnella luojiensis]TFE28206.1 hypothetical protein E2980_08295 [Cohnella luojiensis]
MAKRVVLAISHREYAAKLAEYLREEETGWDIGVYTHGSALRKELQNNAMVDLLIGQADMLLEAGTLCDRAGKVISLVKQKGMVDGRWQEIVQYQPLPSILSGIRSGMAANQGGSTSGCQVVTVFSASGGVGKTTVALNLIRQAGERGLRTFYMNMEALNATSLLFGKGEPDSLSRLLYALQAHPEQWDSLLEQLCRHQPQLRTDYVDAPDHPGERLALTPELMEALLEKFRNMGRYDMIVIDPDSGAGEWHRRLLDLSDRVVWLIADDAQGLMKSEKLLRYWQAHISEKISKLSFVLNKAIGGGLINQWNLPGEAPKVVLPYIPQWKTIDQPGRLLASPAFSGAVEQLLLGLEIGGNSPSVRRRREEGHGNQRSHVRGAG